MFSLQARRASGTKGGWEEGQRRGRKWRETQACRTSGTSGGWKEG